THEKGWDTLVEAARRLALKGREFQVDMIGDGDDFEAMKQRVTAAGLSERFRIRGRLDARASQAALVGALAAVVPSRYQEAAGYIPLEAAAHRVASIVTRVGGLAETAGPDCPSFAAGNVEELEERMTRFLDNPSQALTAGYAAYLRAGEQFSPQVIANE